MSGAKEPKWGDAMRLTGGPKGENAGFFGIIVERNFRAPDKLEIEPEKAQQTSGEDPVESMESAQAGGT